ncbi:Asp23/Gls24 family envelope stress response protein [Chloroflexota bacterium]
MTKSKVQIKDLEMTARLKEIENQTEYTVGGETFIDDEVIAQIAGVAAKEVEGVAGLGKSSIRRTIAEAVGSAEGRARGVDVEAGKKEAILDLTLNVIYGFSIPNIVIEVRKNVATRLLEMVGLIAKEINVDIVNIEFPERMPGKIE